MGNKANLSGATNKCKHLSIQFWNCIVKFPNCIVKTGTTPGTIFSFAKTFAMLQLLPAIGLFIYCIYGFFKECRLERERFLEQDRLGDEHIMREIEKFLRERGIPFPQKENNQ